MSKRKKSQADNGLSPDEIRPTPVVTVVTPRCPKCGSINRSAYYGCVTQNYQGVRPDGTRYQMIIRRRCRCADCGQMRIDREYS